MKRTSVYTLIAIVALPAMLASCNKYLDLKPRDKFLEEQVYGNELNINAALNGIYMDMASNNLYGANLSMTTMEILAQRYNVDQYHALYMYATYKYQDTKVAETFDAIWSSAYANILNINMFIDRLSQSKNVITTDKANVLLGEAYGLRALLHFDMLRIFGPVYNSPDSLKAVLPYYTKALAYIAPQLPANSMIDAILLDLHIADSLLANDPVITKGTSAYLSNDGNDFYNNFRNRHMNYYAVKGLEARVHLYRRDKPAAYAAAKAVLDNGEKWFPWTTASEMTNGNNPDRICSKEILFGVQNQAMYTNQTNFFATTLLPKNILIPRIERLNESYGNSVSDFRYVSSWAPYTNSRSFVKYTDILSTDSMYRMFQPLLRKSELYYIAAECAPDKPTQLNYLNTVRTKRGLGPLGSSANMNNEIMAEYIKEFYGEGQLFFFYKRKATPAIPNATLSTGTVIPGYVVPLPASETNPR